MMTWPPAYTIKTHPRARSIKLSICKEHGLRITLPKYCSKRAITSALEEHRDWIIKHLSTIKAKTPFSPPDAISLQALNKIWKIQYINTANKTRLLERPKQEELVIYGQTHQAKACQVLLNQWTREKAKIALPLLFDQVSQEIQIPYNKISIRQQARRWGTCGAHKNIVLNYKLIFLPFNLTKHIMIHELCHTYELNHSANFWKLVAKFDPEWQTNKKAIRQADQHIPEWT